MVDKKIAAIAILCMATVLCLGLWANSGQEVKRLEGELGTLEDSYESLNSKYVKVVEDYDRLNSDYSNLEAEKAKLETDYSNLKTVKDKLVADYSSLYDTYLGWKNAYDNLKKEYDKLSTIFDEAKAIAESAEWISEDKRLKVTSKLIPNMWNSYLSSYTVRVTVTNIGNEPIDKVVILVFPYKDGKFASIYLTGYESHSVESLYIGETYSHDFTYLPKEMNSYSVLAVAG